MKGATGIHPFVRGAFWAAGIVLAMGILWLVFIREDKKPSGSPAVSEKVPPKKVARSGSGKSVQASARVSDKSAVSTGVVSSAKAGNTNNMTAGDVARTPAEREAAAMRDLLDSGDEKGALKIARKLVDSPEAAVRSQVVSVLGWIGVRALPELTQLLADANEGIADEALTQWRMAYDELQDNGMKAELLQTAVSTMRKEEDMESLVMSVDQFPTDVAVRTLVKLVQGENAAASKVAREHYSFLTQTDFTTPQAAEQWIQANVEPAEVVP